MCRRKEDTNFKIGDDVVVNPCCTHATALSEMATATFTQKFRPLKFNAKE